MEGDKKHTVKTVDYTPLTVADAYRILAERGAPADEEGLELPALYALLAASEDADEVRFAHSAQEPK